MRHGGQILVHQFKSHKCGHVFAVPGKAIVSILDGLYDNARIRTITCRSESSASLMAMSSGLLGNIPGICMVSDRQGAARVAPGILAAHEKAAPVILIVGLPSTEQGDSGALAGADIVALYGNAVKYSAIVETASRIPEYFSRAWRLALSGRPGPAVIGIPVNILQQRAHTEDLGPGPRATAAPAEADMERFREMLFSSSRPLVVVGGSGWNRQAAENIMKFASLFNLPVAAAFRCQDYVDNHHPNYVGHLGPGMNPGLTRLVSRADLLLNIGAEPREESLLVKRPGDSSEQMVVNVHCLAQTLSIPDRGDLLINADTPEFAQKLVSISPPRAIQWEKWCSDARKIYESFLVPSDTPGDVKLEYIIRVINEVVPENTIITYGDGNYSDWIHRYYQFRNFQSQQAPATGFAESALPAAIASKLAHPEACIVAITGDGGFMMNVGELATAVQYGLGITVIVVNNRMYGAARLAQETSFPGRVLGTSLNNPDFLKLAESFGAVGERVEHRKAFRTVFKRALKAGTVTVIDLPVSENALTASRTSIDLLTE